MKIWIDADSCPREVRRIICKAASKRKVNAFFISNAPVDLPQGQFIKRILVGSKLQAADRYILAYAASTDLIITRDIPLAAEAVEKRISVINDRGIVYTPDNVAPRLSERNFMYELRAQGIQSIEKTRVFNKKDITAFANAFDRELTRLLKLFTPY